MSKLTIDEIEDTNGNNNSSVISIQRSVDKKDFLDWYENGDIVVTQRELDENNFLKIGKNTVIDELRHPQGHQYFENIFGKEKTKQNVLTVLDYKTKEGSSLFSIQVDDFKFFEFFSGNSIIKEHTFDKYGNITNTVDKNIGPNTTGGNLSWDVNYSTQDNINVLYLKINTDLFCYIKDYNADAEYSFNVTGFFQNKLSRIKITNNYAYELAHDTALEPRETTLYRYPLQKTNATPDSTPTTIVTKTGLDATFTNTFSGVNNSGTYGFGQDIDIIFTKDADTLDELIFASKETTYTDYYISTINSDGTRGSEFNLSFNPINYDSYLFNTVQTSIKNDNNTGIVKSHNFIKQTRRNQLIFGTLIQENSNGDILKSGDHDVFNKFIFQIIDLNGGSLISHNESYLNEIFDEHENGKHCFDVIATNDRSVTLIEYIEDPQNTDGSGQLNYFQTNRLINWNINDGFYDVGTNTYYRYQLDNYYTYETKNKANANIKVLRDTYDSGVNVDFFYQSRNSQSKIEAYNDDFYACILPSTDLGLTVLFTQKGFHFSEYSDSENINTYMRIN